MVWSAGREEMKKRPSLNNAYLTLTTNNGFQPSMRAIIKMRRLDRSWPRAHEMSQECSDMQTPRERQPLLRVCGRAAVRRCAFGNYLPCWVSGCSRQRVGTGRRKIWWQDADE